ncbi:hypothetical protein FRB95_012502 [Tulasnella sp. JGI-2019a]|nr:hypothetical protein FRB95_012502 [Tulasnella sp. JGI-2019a]
MDDYMVHALNIFSEGASRTARSQLSLDDPKLTELQSSIIMLRSLDDALKTFTDGLHRLRSSKARHHNTLLPISRFPNELLVKIFTLASVQKKDISMEPNALRRRRRNHSCFQMAERMLETLVFVCQEWKEIVYDAPSLWAHIRTDRPRAANLGYLDRSCQAPLHISINSFDLQYGEFKAKIFQEIHRWKSVAISGMTREHLEELEQWPAPLLERLYLHYGPNVERAFNLFCGSASRLRHLALSEVRIPWESDLLSRLRTLEIRHDEDGLSAQQVVYTLRSCPDIISFTLCLPQGLDPGPMPLDTLTIDLPQLEHLFIMVHPLMTEDLLRRMRIPRCKSFGVTQVGATGPAFTAAMEGHIPSLSSILLAASELSISITPTFLEYITTATAEIDDDDEQQQRYGEQRIHIRASGDPFTSLETLSWLLDNVHILPFSLPISLNISQITSQAIMPTIGRLSSAIAELELALDDASSVKTIISYLAEPSKVDVDGTTMLRWPLPHLKDLSFRLCHYLEPGVVLACVQRRAGRGLSLEGRGEHCEELPARLTRLCLPQGSSAAAVMGMFPDCMEWCGLELEQPLERDIFGGSDTDHLSED